MRVRVRVRVRVRWAVARAIAQPSALGRLAPRRLVPASLLGLAPTCLGLGLGLGVG